MRTHRAFSAAAAALALFAAAGCCETNRPDCPPAPSAPVVVVAAPAPAPAVKAAVYRPNRWPLRRRCDQPADCCQCAVQAEAAAPAVVVAAAEPAKALVAAPQVLVVEPAKKDAAGKTMTVLRRGRKGRILCREGRIVVVKPAAAPVAVVSEPAVVEPIIIPEPVAVIEPAVEEPSWTKYLAPEQPTVIAADPYTLPAEPYALPVEPTAQFIASEPYAVAAPAPVSVPAYAGQRPIVIQPVIQPVVQTGQDVLAGQVQMAQVTMTQPLVTFQPAQPYAPPVAVPPVAIASVAPVPPAPPVVLAVPPTAAQDKYGALTPVAPVASLPAERPEVSMPAPLGQTTSPRVAGTDEIENALDVMMGNAPVLK